MSIENNFKIWRDQVVLKIDCQLPDENNKLFTIDSAKAVITAPNSFTVVNNRQFSKINGIASGEWNIGTVAQAPEYTWTLELPMSSPHVELFRALQMTRRNFTLISGSADLFSTPVNKDSVYQPRIEYWNYCYVTSCNKSLVQNPNSAPLYKIEGVAFRHTYEYMTSTGLSALGVDLGNGWGDMGAKVSGTTITVDRSKVFPYINEEDRDIWVPPADESS